MLGGFGIRIGEHLANIRKGFGGHSLSQHFSQCHSRDPSSLEVIGIEKYTPHWRGSNLRRQISHREIQWIFYLKTSLGPQYTVEWDINSFINNS